MTETNKPPTVEDLANAIRQVAIELIKGHRDEGLSDAEIEKKIGRPLPPEWRRE